MCISVVVPGRCPAPHACLHPTHFPRDFRPSSALALMEDRLSELQATESRQTTDIEKLLTQVARKDEDIAGLRAELVATRTESKASMGALMEQFTAAMAKMEELAATVADAQTRPRTRSESSASSLPPPPAPHAVASGREPSPPVSPAGAKTRCVD